MTICIMLISLTNDPDAMTARRAAGLFGRFDCRGCASGGWLVGDDLCRVSSTPYWVKAVNPCSPTPWTRFVTGPSLSSRADFITSRSRKTRNIVSEARPLAPMCCILSYVDGTSRSGVSEGIIALGHRNSQRSSGGYKVSIRLTFVDRRTRL